MGDIIDRDALELFFGDATDAEARVYARLPGDAPLDGWQLTGTLTGPECRFAKTLPAKFSFATSERGKGLLAEAIIDRAMLLDARFAISLSLRRRWSPAFRLSGGRGWRRSRSPGELSPATGASLRSSPGHPAIEGASRYSPARRDWSLAVFGWRALGSATAALAATASIYPTWPTHVNRPPSSASHRQTTPSVSKPAILACHFLWT